MSRLIRICIMALIAVVCLGLFVSQTEAIPLEITQEGTEESTTNSSSSICAEGNPCGWIVYGTSKEKKIQYKIRNTCRCKGENTCLLSHDDLSLTAWVYRCSSRPISD